MSQARFSLHTCPSLPAHYTRHSSRWQTGSHYSRECLAFLKPVIPPPPPLFVPLIGPFIGFNPRTINVYCRKDEPFRASFFFGFTLQFSLVNIYISACLFLLFYGLKFSSPLLFVCTFQFSSSSPVIYHEIEAKFFVLVPSNYTH